MSGRVTAVVGGQYGSEGKGVVVNEIADRYSIHVRVGGPNAGHSFYDRERLIHPPTLFKMQMLPCGWTNSSAHLVIGPGAVVDLDRLADEVELVSEHLNEDVWDRVLVSGNAAVLDSRHHGLEGGVDGEMHQRIGSTGEGVGAARIARLSRDPNKITMVRYAYHPRLPDHCIMENTSEWLTEQIRWGENVLLEGTQGFGLSLIHGPWPYVTSADTTAGQLVVDSGISPLLLTDVLMVVRTYPIRVAGNSGPMYRETTWDAISAKMGKPTIERTTVTQKVRRIGEWDEYLVERAVAVNAPTHFALMFLDYLNPQDEGQGDFTRLSHESQNFIIYLENRFDTPVAFAGTGGPEWEVIDRGLF